MPRHRYNSRLMKSRASALLRWLLLLAVGTALALIAWQVTLRLLRPDLTVTTVVEAPVVQAFYATGTLLPEREYPIKSNNNGIITQVFVDKGDQLKIGQPLAIVYEDAVQFRFEQAQAELDEKKKLADEKTSPILQEIDARAAAAADILQIAKNEELRLRRLMETNGAARVEWERALDRVKTFAGEVEALKAQRKTRLIELQKDQAVAESALKIAQWNLDRQTIRSPLDNAAVLDRPMPVGTRVNANDHIMQIADVRPDHLVMRAAVDEEDKIHVKPGQLVRMTLYSFPDRALEGRVKKIYDKADADRRTFEIDISMIEKDERYSAGMTGELAFVIAAKDKALVVPSQAVQNGKVWIVRDGALHSADVKIGLASIERVEILAGLTPTDRVVLSPLENPQEGQRVRTTFLDPTTAANLNKPKQEKAFQSFN